MCPVSSITHFSAVQELIVSPKIWLSRQLSFYLFPSPSHHLFSPLLLVAVSKYHCVYFLSFFARSSLCFSLLISLIMSLSFICPWYRMCCSNVCWLWSTSECRFGSGEQLIKRKRKMGRDEASAAKDGPIDVWDYLTRHWFWLLQTNITGQER